MKATNDFSEKRDIGARKLQRELDAGRIGKDEFDETQRQRSKNHGAQRAETERKDESQ